MINLHQPEKYKVYTGNGPSVGLCTAWNEPERLFNKSEALRKKVAILGSLYSRQGVNIIVRNLALNPTIRKVYVWANGHLSQTELGRIGTSILFSLWKNGIGSDGTVIGTNFKLEKEIDPTVVEKVRTNVELLDVSKLPLEEVEKMFEKETAMNAYMEQIKFPDHEYEAASIFPSEEIGWLTQGRTVLETWSRVVERIMRYGKTKTSQYYGTKFRELVGVSWVIGNENAERPDLALAGNWPEGLRSVTGATAKAIKEYQENFMKPELPSGIDYTYGSRLFAYPAVSGPLDQVQEMIIKQLKGSHDSTSAVATTLFPDIDRNHSFPCLSQVQAIVIDEKLNLLVSARSHDIFKAAILNAFGFLKLRDFIAAELSIDTGRLQMISQSAHIYEQDWDDASKLTRCLFWEREPDHFFDPIKNADPRGNLIITVGQKISAVLNSPDGQELLKIEGDSARVIADKIVQLELFNRPDHLLDIGMELQKAETSLKNKLEYRQDRSLQF